MAIETESTSESKNTGKASKEDPSSGSKSINKSIVSRPLLPPNELLDLKPGTIYVYCYTYNPLKSQVTHFYKCIQNNLIQVYKEPDMFIASKYFDEAAVYYDIRRRNEIIIKGNKKNDIFDW
jgi:type IV secretory pathway TraG/TraD family ATPase VirD4